MSIITCRLAREIICAHVWIQDSCRNLPYATHHATFVQWKKETEDKLALRPEKERDLVAPALAGALGAHNMNYESARKECDRLVMLFNTLITGERQA